MKSIQIVSPHIDDAFLSLGGCIVKWIEKGFKVTVYNIFTISNWVAPDSLSGIEKRLTTDEVTRLRKREEMLVQKKARFRYECWDFLDFPLRKRFSKNDDIRMANEIAMKLRPVVNEGDLIFFPSAVGNHNDHILINKIGRSFSREHSNIAFFEDMPYTSWAETNFQTLYKKNLKDKMPICEKINSEIKMKILKLYSSQITAKFLSSIESYSYNPIDNTNYERFWVSKAYQKNKKR